MIFNDLEEAKKHQNIGIFFQDPMHQIHNNENDYGWQIKGKLGTKQVLANTGRRRINIIGALNPLSLIPTIVITEDNCDAWMTVAFLEELKKENQDMKKIYVYLDNARYNHAKIVKEKAKELGIILRYLLPYSPNLNLIERLWRFFKKKVMKNKYYRTFEEFYRKIIYFFQNYEKYLPELRTLLTLNFEIIKAS